MGLVGRLLGGGEGDAEERGEQVGERLDALAQLDAKWSTERVRRRVRDVFFAVQRSWIERDPGIAEPYVSASLMERQRLRIDGLVSQHRVHQLENPLIEDLDFIRYDEAAPSVTVLLDISLVETILDAGSRAVVAGRANEKIRHSEFWTFAWEENWKLDEVEQPGEGARHLKAPLVGGDYATLSPESVLRERYARGEIELDEFEAEMAELLSRDRRY